MSITLVKEENGVLPISPQKYPRLLVYGLESKDKVSDTNMGAVEDAVEHFISFLKAEGYAVTKFIPDGKWEGLAVSTQEIISQYDLIIYVANLATKSNQTVVRIEWAQPMGADVPVYIHSVPTIFISLENPYHLLDVPRMKTYINTYGSSDEILASLMEKLQGKSAFIGKSPVDAFCGNWDTRL
jgi:beta-N-acetylhexosaminidase